MVGEIYGVWVERIVKSFLEKIVDFCRKMVYFAVNELLLIKLFFYVQKIR